MSDTIVSFIRTWVPVAIGSAITWLFETTGFLIPEDAGSGLVVFMTGVVIAIYYAVARVLETRFPWLGFLLGKPATPTYTQ